MKIEFLLGRLQMKNTNVEEICSINYIEIKYFDDFGLSGARFCRYGTS